MKHADKVIELMAAYPGRPFRMVEVVKYVNPVPTNNKERKSLHMTVWRALEAFVAAGAIVKRTAKMNGSYGTYTWKQESQKTIT